MPLESDYEKYTLNGNAHVAEYYDKRKEFEKKMDATKLNINTTIPSLNGHTSKSEEARASVMDILERMETKIDTTGKLLQSIQEFLLELQTSKGNGPLFKSSKGFASAAGKKGGAIVKARWAEKKKAVVADASKKLAPYKHLNLTAAQMAAVTGLTKSRIGQLKKEGLI